MQTIQPKIRKITEGKANENLRKFGYTSGVFPLFRTFWKAFTTCIDISKDIYNTWPIQCILNQTKSCQHILKHKNKVLTISTASTPQRFHQFSRKKKYLEISDINKSSR